MDQTGLFRTVLDWLKRLLDLLGPVRSPNPVGQEVRVEK
jgi:hypothetical protein